MANAKRVAEIKKSLEADPKYMAQCRALAARKIEASRTPAQRAQAIKAEIFKTCDALIIPPDFGTNPKAECTPVFYTEAEKNLIVDSQLRACADAVERQIRADELLQDLLED
jgi:hypothetical protein